MRCKSGQLGEGVTGIVKIVMVSLIALVVLGLSSVFYEHHIDIKNSEANILARQVIDCFVPDGKFDLGAIDEKEDIFSYCDFSGGNLERFFVRFLITDKDGKVIRKHTSGDEGSLWVKKLYDMEIGTDSIKKYKPGYFPNNDIKYAVYVTDVESSYEADLFVEVIVQDE